jgi:ribosomal protein L21E
MRNLDKAAEKIGKVMGEYKDKELHSGKGGKVVKSRKQAIAIALSEANRAKK